MKMKMKKAILLITTAALCILLTAGCSKKPVNSETIDVNIAASIKGLEHAQQLRYFSLTVTAPGLGIIAETDLELIEGQLVGSVVVLAGEDRNFSIIARNIDSTIIYRGATRQDIFPGQAVTIEIALSPVVPMLKFVPRFMAVPMGVNIELDIHVYNTPNLGNIDFRVLLGSLTSYDAFSLSPELSLRAYWYMRDDTGYAFTVTDIGSMTNDTGYVHLGTMSFITSSSDFDTATNFIDIVPLSYMGPNEEPIDIDTMYNEGTTLKLYDLNTRIIGAWNFNNDDSNIVYDIYDNALNGIAYGTQIVPHGEFEMARLFDGVDDYVEIPDDDLLDLDEELAIQFEILLDSTTGNDIILAKGSPDGNVNYRIRYFNSTSQDPDFIQFEFTGPGGTRNRYRTYVNLVDYEWHTIFYTVKFGDPRVSYFWIDGSIYDGEWITGDNMSMPPVTVSPLYLGRSASETDPEYFGGRLDNIFILDVGIRPEWITPRPSLLSNP